VQRVPLFGAKQESKTPEGMWPSDHVAVVGQLNVQKLARNCALFFADAAITILSDWYHYPFGFKAQLLSASTCCPFLHVRGESFPLPIS